MSRPTYIKSLKVDHTTRYLHVSKVFQYTPEGQVLWYKGQTLNEGRSKVKRAIWDAKQAAKRERRALKKARITDGIMSATVQ